MRLNNSDRDAFVMSVMEDVPYINYGDVVRKEISEWALARMPEVVRKAFKAHPEWINQTYFSTPYGLDNVSIHAPDNMGMGDCGEFKVRIEELARLNKEQEAERKKIRAQVAGMISGCTTLKQAKERLPEFHKYLPADRDGEPLTNMPAVANVVTSLMQAGWPKEKAK